MNSILNIQHIKMSYGTQPIINDLSLNLEEGQIGCLLGESGCGKTSVLRTIAGFEEISEGEIWLGGQLLSSKSICSSPAKRKIGMVFQDYALFPHLSVHDNVAFGLKELTATEKQQRICSTLDMVGLSTETDKFPHELSGGQQQRVALARALAMRPRLLLMDEPFSNLDVTLREKLSTEVRSILKECKTSALFVTHNQLEAFALADVVGVMQSGKILQWDSSYNLYHKPASPFVANFIGEGRFLQASMEDGCKVHTALGCLSGKFTQEPKNKEFRGKVLIRPEDVIHDDGSQVKAKVMRRSFRGPNIMYELQLVSGETVQALVPSYCEHEVDEAIGIRSDVRHIVLFAE